MESVAKRSWESYLISEVNNQSKALFIGLAGSCKIFAFSLLFDNTFHHRGCSCRRQYRCNDIFALHELLSPSISQSDD